MVGLDQVDATVCLSFVEQLAAVCGQLWKTVMTKSYQSSQNIVVFNANIL